MPPRRSSSLSGRRRLQWLLSVCLLAGLVAGFGSRWNATARAGLQPLSSAAQVSVSSDAPPASTPPEALDVDGDSNPDLILPDLAVTVVLPSGPEPRDGVTAATMPSGRQIAPLPLPPRPFG